MRFRMAPRRRYDYRVGKKNPLGRDGQPLKCSIRGSDEHLRAFCPNKKKGFGGGGKARGKGGTDFGGGRRVCCLVLRRCSGLKLLCNRLPPSDGKARAAMPGCATDDEC